MTTDHPAAPHVELDAAEHRFILRDPRGTGELRYNIIGSQIILEHTEVAPALRGGGGAGLLARTALEYARDHQLAVIPVCPFVLGYLARHPEYRPLVYQPPPPANAAE
jgi:uncharacterized protein